MRIFRFYQEGQHQKRIDGKNYFWDTWWVEWLDADGDIQRKKFEDGDQTIEKAQWFAGTEVPEVSQGYRLTPLVDPQKGYNAENPTWTVQFINTATLRWENAVGDDGNVLTWNDETEARGFGERWDLGGNGQQTETSPDWNTTSGVPLGDGALPGYPAAPASATGAAPASGTRPNTSSTSPNPFGPGGYTSGGGGGGGAYGGYGTAAGNTGDPATDADIDAFVRKNYPYLAGYLAHPEIGPILRQAAVEGWDSARLQGAVSATNWWKTTSATARTFDAEMNLDPATAMQKVTAKEAELQRQAAQLGLTIGGDVTMPDGSVLTGARFLAIQSLREGWTPQDITKRLLVYGAYDVTKTQTGGIMKATADDVIKLAGDYMLPMSTTAANGYAKQLAEGTITIEGIESILREQAAGRFPGLADSIRRGVKPAQFFDSYKQQIGALLEMDPDQIDLMSPKWAAVVDTVGADGSRRPMTLYEVQKYVRSTPEYDSTHNAYEEAVQLGEVLGKTFGMVG